MMKKIMDIFAIKETFGDDIWLMASCLFNAGDSITVDDGAQNDILITRIDGESWNYTVERMNSHKNVIRHQMTEQMILN